MSIFKECENCICPSCENFDTCYIALYINTKTRCENCNRNDKATPRDKCLQHQTFKK